MAGHLQAAGHTLLLAKHRTPLPAELLAGGAVVHETYQTLAADAEVVILMLPQTKQVQSVLFDPGGVSIEDLAAADLDGDGKTDIVAVGRHTHNVRIYWNQTQ